MPCPFPVGNWRPLEPGTWAGEVKGLLPCPPHQTALSPGAWEPSVTVYTQLKIPPKREVHRDLRRLGAMAPRDLGPAPGPSWTPGGGGSMVGRQEGPLSLLPQQPLRSPPWLQSCRRDRIKKAQKVAGSGTKALCSPASPQSQPSTWSWGPYQDAGCSCSPDHGTVFVASQGWQRAGKMAPA